MIKCPKCGQTNDASGNFCRFCGLSFAAVPQRPVPPQQYPAQQYPPQYPQQFPQPGPAPQNFENSPPRPYSWKTDEFRTDPRKGGTAPVGQFRSLGATQPDLNMQPYAPQHMVTGYHCPRCHSQLLPRRERRISTAGWIVFGVLMVAFFPLFWIGLLIREDVSVCPVCNHKFPTG